MMTPGYYSSGVKRAGERQGLKDSGAACTPGSSSRVGEVELHAWLEGIPQVQCRDPSSSSTGGK